MSLKGTVWAPIGPSPLARGAVDENGQVTSIAVHPNNPKIIYIGTAWGGIWRTHDGGDHWTPFFDHALSLGIGEPGGVAIDPVDTNTLYAGTSSREGSQFAGGVSATQPSAGLFKSIDGGASWGQLGSNYPPGFSGNASQFIGQRITVVIVDPTDNQTVYLSSSSGFFRSTDGGRNWTKGTGASGDMQSLVLDPTSPPSSRILFGGLSSAGVVRSVDGGRTWSNVLNAGTPAIAAKLAGGGFGKVVVALAPPSSPANPGGIQVLYVTMSGGGPTPDPVGLFLSTDQGGTWAARNVAPLIGTSYGGYCLELAVDPASPGDGAADVVYLGTLNQSISIDAGANFTNISSGAHADTHAFAFIKQVAPTPSIVLCGNDGGIYRSIDRGTNWKGLNRGGLQTCLFYNFDLKPDATASFTVGGLQDNSVVVGPVGAPGWNTGAGAGGDGWAAAYDGQVAKKVYSSSNITLGVSTDDGGTYAGAPLPGPPTEFGLFLFPVATDPSTGNVVYTSGSTRVWQSTTGGASWGNSFPFPGVANHIAVAPANGNNVVVAIGSRVFVSTNALAPGGFTFTDITRHLPGSNVARAMFDPNDPMIVYCVLSGFTGGGHVFRTSVAASAWTDISPANPGLDLPFNAIALDGNETPTAIYCGTDFGVVQSLDGGATWSVLDAIHFPRAPVFDMKYQNGILRAATFGRGVFELVKPTGPAIAIDPEAGLAFGTVCASTHLALQIFNVGSADLLIKSVQRLAGSTAINVLATPATPLFIKPGEDASFQVVFAPSTPPAFERTTIRIASNDPAAPFVDLDATGRTGAPRASLSIADGGNFGNVCRGSFADETLTINNSGTCTLAVSSISSSSPEFIAPTLSGVLLVGAGESVGVAIRFQPTAAGARSATLTVASNDPAGPSHLAVSGTAPSGQLAITGSSVFGGVHWGHREQRTLFICNLGSCDLHVASVALQHPHRHFRLINNPFPAVVHPGSSLAVVVQYKATARIARACELVVTSDDPVHPVQTVELLAFSIPREDDEDDKDHHHDDEDEDGDED